MKPAIFTTIDIRPADVNKRQTLALTHMWNGPGCKIFF